jgi:septal ring factor EnvC (AmiA/AmiB activator)
MRYAAALLLLLLTVPITGFAAEVKDIAQIKKNLESTQKQENALSEEVDKGEGELQQLRRNLVKAAREQANSEDVLVSLHKRLENLQDKQEQQRKELSQQQAKLAEILAALLRVARTPPEALITSPNRPVDTMRSAILMRAALPHYKKEAERLTGQLDDLEKTRADIQERQKELQDAQKNFGDKQDELNKLLAARENWLKATESQRAELKKQIANLSREAQNVQDLMQKVALSPIKIPNRMTKKGVPNFVAPAKGRLLYAYGATDDVGSPSRGITMRVKGGDMIVAPADGQVVFAGPFRGYGNILILRHGDDYHSFMAGFGRLDATVGQVVNAGEPLGSTSLEQGTQAQFYYELRHRGAPVDPSQHIQITNVATLEKN